LISINKPKARRIAANVAKLPELLEGLAPQFSFVSKLHRANANILASGATVSRKPASGTTCP